MMLMKIPTNEATADMFVHEMEWAWRVSPFGRCRATWTAKAQRATHCPKSIQLTVEMPLLLSRFFVQVISFVAHVSNSGTGHLVRPMLRAQESQE
jgi:hypothetical protein